MHTITVTAARAKLGHWLARAVRGEEIGVIVGAKVVALRPVSIQAADYLETEYGLSTEEADRAVARLKAETQEAKAAGELIPLEEFAANYAPGRRRQKRLRRSSQTRS